MQLNDMIITSIRTNAKLSASFMLVGLTLMLLAPFVLQISNAQSFSRSPIGLKFFKIKAELNKTVIARGQEQKIQFTVVDSKSGQPLGGAITRATVVYPAGNPVRQFSAFTDSSGHSTITFNIEDDAPLDTYVVRYDVFLQGYAEENFNGNFGVVVHSVSGNHHNNDHNHDHHHN